MEHVNRKETKRMYLPLLRNVEARYDIHVFLPVFTNAQCFFGGSANSAHL